MEKKKSSKECISDRVRGLILLASLILLFVGVVIATTSGLSIVRPRLWARNFQRSTCKAIDQEALGSNPCGCGGSYCRSTYPCIRITVQYDVTNNDTSSPSDVGVIYLNEAVAMHEDKCFAESCQQNEFANNESISSLVLKYGLAGSSYPCFYNPKNKQQIIVGFLYSMKDLQRAIALPGALIIISLLMIAFSAMHCKCSMHSQHSSVTVIFKSLKLKFSKYFSNVQSRPENGTNAIQV